MTLTIEQLRLIVLLWVVSHKASQQPESDFATIVGGDLWNSHRESSFKILNGEIETILLTWKQMDKIRDVIVMSLGEPNEVRVAEIASEISDGDPERFSQLMALVFYLQQVIKKL